MRLVIVVFAAACASQAHSATFVVEDDALLPIPERAISAIGRVSVELPTDYDGKPCQFIGKAVALSPKSEMAPADWIVTTRDACSWAASAAPVWVLQRIGAEYEVVLFHVTYAVTLGSRTKNGLRHIDTFRATAARTETQLWTFDGEEYQLAKMQIEESSR